MTDVPCKQRAGGVSTGTAWQWQALTGYTCLLPHLQLMLAQLGNQAVQPGQPQGVRSARHSCGRLHGWLLGQQRWAPFGQGDAFPGRRAGACQTFLEQAGRSAQSMPPAQHPMQAQHRASMPEIPCHVCCVHLCMTDEPSMKLLLENHRIKVTGLPCNLPPCGTWSVGLQEVPLLCPAGRRAMKQTR